MSGAPECPDCGLLSAACMCASRFCDACGAWDARFEVRERRLCFACATSRAGREEEK